MNASARDLCIAYARLPFLTPARVRFFAENRRRWDLTNAAESVMDLLVEEGLLEDDCVENVPELALSYGGVDKENARAEVEIVIEPERGG